MHYIERRYTHNLSDRVQYLTVYSKGTHPLRGELKKY
ncbi:hypothetical protein G166_gp72 [Clostridium phage phi8074-B1]|nr:hypothetical protein G166_gp72 [Clostridium phage phi8074-B1]AFC62004.1 hypothetical protein phi8074-B1_00072 [Clostridium phage phi8074-B1]